MSQEQQDRPPEKPIKYGDVFSAVKDTELAEKTVAPRDAAMMQTAEDEMLGRTIKGGAASKMQSAASQNEKGGFVGRDEFTDAAADGGVSITETDLPGKRIITEAVGGQVVGEYSQRAPVAPPSSSVPGTVTIGEALEAAVLTAGEKPVERSDAAAIQAAEVRATGRDDIVPGGVAASAQSAATHNARVVSNEDKTKLADVLAGASGKLPAEKPVTRKDAEGVTGAEMRNDPNLTTHPTGVAASVAAAARININK